MEKGTSFKKKLEKKKNCDVQRCEGIKIKWKEKKNVDFFFQMPTGWLDLNKSFNESAHLFNIYFECIP